MKTNSYTPSEEGSMDIDNKLRSLGAATFGSYLQRAARLARFQIYHERQAKESKRLEQVRQRARKEIEDRTALVAAAHTLAYMKTDSVMIIDLPTVE
jgi:hypothetical protein